MQLTRHRFNYRELSCWKHCLGYNIALSCNVTDPPVGSQAVRNITNTKSYAIIDATNSTAQRDKLLATLQEQTQRKRWVTNRLQTNVTQTWVTNWLQANVTQTFGLQTGYK